MTNVILLFYAGLFAAMFWVLAALVNRWDEDHHELKALQRDQDELYQQFYKLRDFAELTRGLVNNNAETAAANDEAIAKANLNIRNDISKLSIRVNKLEGKENNNE